ncbi:MAG: hypothetical protein AAF790_02540 [Planctomycetota bacterium]
MSSSTTRPRPQRDQTPAAQLESLQEYADSRDARLRIDRTASLLQGVKLLGLTSRNGRRYQEGALRAAMHLYEGAKVNVNHPDGDPHAPRDYRDRIGVIRGVRLLPGDGLYGALQFNPKHPLAEQLAWDAEHAPENVGFSHNVIARTRRDAAGVVVEAIDRVRSVDLVADPATTRGLFEQADAPPHPRAEPPRPRAEEAPARGWDRLTLHELELHRPDLLRELAEQHQAQLVEKQRRIDELTESEARLRREQRIQTLLLEHELPLPGTPGGDGPATSEVFLQSLLAAPNDEALEQLIADRAEAIAGAAAPRSRVVAREQALGDGPQASGPADTPSFVAAITTRG